MIFVAAGTQDGRELVKFLLQKNFRVIASVVSSYGESLLREIDESFQKNLFINEKPLDENELKKFLKEHEIKIFVDASHPYAKNVSVNAMQACRACEIPYVRYERDSVASSYEKIFSVESYEAMAQKLHEENFQRIFLTTGSRNLELFAKIFGEPEKLIARVLPTTESLAICEKAKISPKNICAMQGPFSKELNKILFEEFHADVIVTKNSGKIGGTDTKILAAQELNLPVIVLNRPEIVYENLTKTFDEVFEFIQKNQIE